MKQSKMMLIIAVLIIGCNIPSFAQDLLPEVKVVASNYKYLKSVTDTTSAQPVRMLQQRAASFDVKSSEFYEEDYEDYFISFYIPDGQILATYDQKGNLIRTAEKYKNVALPAAVRQAVTKRFPEWIISQDVYLVNFSEAQGGKKVYKMTLQNGDKRLKIKTNEKGDFL
jgi:hypothetical protein